MGRSHLRFEFEPSDPLQQWTVIPDDCTSSFSRHSVLGSSAFLGQLDADWKVPKFCVRRRYFLWMAVVDDDEAVEWTAMTDVNVRRRRGDGR